MRLKTVVCALPSHPHPERADPTAPAQFAALLRSISRCETSINERHHQVLVSEILHLPMWQISDACRQGLLQLIVHLVVANSSFVSSCLLALVQNLLPAPGMQTSDSAPGTPWIPLPECAATQDDVITTCLQVLELIPSSSPRLLELLTSNIPHKLRDRATQCLYFRALFQLAEAPAGVALREGLLSAVIYHVLDVDVEIKWEDIVDIPSEEAREEEGGVNPGEEEPDIFELEGMSELDLATQQVEGIRDRGGWEGGFGASPYSIGKYKSVDTPPGAVTEAPASSAHDETADKLDSLMELVFAHLARRVAAGQLPATWSTTLQAFERFVLHAHRSKFAQFVIFYLARHAPELCCRSLLESLMMHVNNTMVPSLTRSAAAAYIGSFLARAAYVPQGLVVEGIKGLLDWCLQYAKDEECRGGLPPIPSSSALHSPLPVQDARDRHVAFYAMCQSLLYVLCYHMKMLVSQRPSVVNDIFGSNGMPRLLTHRLSPLSFCALSVVIEFGRQARAYSQNDTADAVQAWEQGSLEGKTSAMAKHTSRPLEVFFPFDPYLLERSSKGLELEKTYVKWRRGRPSRKLADDGVQLKMLSRRSALGNETELEMEMEMEDEHDEGEEEGEELESSSGSSSDSSDSSLDSGASAEGVSDDSSSSEISSSSSDMDEMRQTRFGSMATSSMSSQGFGEAGRRGRACRLVLRNHHLGRHHHVLGGSSPIFGVPIPGGSYSTDHGSPFAGMSPSQGPYFGSFAAPMSVTPGQ